MACCCHVAPPPQHVQQSLESKGSGGQQVSTKTFEQNVSNEIHTICNTVESLMAPSLQW